MKQLQEMNAAEAIEHYKALGLNDDAQEIISFNDGADLHTLMWPFNRPVRAWEHSYAYGFIGEGVAGTNDLAIVEAKNTTADQSLRNATINVSLDFLRAFDYPGNGRHNVLFKFTAVNHIGATEENISFNQTYEISEGEHAPIAGYPLFIGLNTGNQVVQFNIEIVNVSNDNDDKLLSVLNNGVVKNGIKLLNSVNPAIPVITEYATGITSMLLERNKNVKVTAPSMGFYFDTIPTHIKMAKGTYIAVQTPNPDQFDWSKWVFNRQSGIIRSSDGTNTDIPFNYFAFSISPTNV